MSDDRRRSRSPRSPVVAETLPDTVPDAPDTESGQVRYLGRQPTGSTQIDSESETAQCISHPNPYVAYTNAAVNFMAAPDDVKDDGSTWYSWDFLWAERDALKAQLQALGRQEYYEWEKAFDAQQDARDRVQLAGMTRSSFLPMPGRDTMEYVERCQRYVTWRRQIRDMTKVQKKDEIQARIDDCLVWWLSRGGGPGGSRRIEMGLCGRNLATGPGRGAGGGI